MEIPNECHEICIDRDLGGCVCVCFMFMPGMFIYKAKRGKLKMLAAKMERKSWRERESEREK